MENQKKKLWTKFIANFMILVMIAVSIPMEGFAEELNNLNSRLQTEELTTKGDEKILKKTEDKTIYQLDNGLKREVLYDGDVRYFEDGKLVDYDPSLIKIKSEKSKNKKDLSNYAYENKQGDKKNYLPNKISEETPILLENDKYSISINSVQEGSKKVSLQKDKITDIYDEEKTLPLKAVYELDDNNTTLEYISQDNGIKENVIFNSIPKSNEIKYELTLENVIPKKCEVEESIIFYDKDDEKNVVASIDPAFINDKTEKAYSEDITYNIEKKKNEKDKYILTITIDEEYLNSSDRVYPVKLDPTITWTGESNLIDTYILSNSNYADVNFYNSGTTAFPIGYTSSMGTCRSLIRSLDLLDTVKGKYVESATLTMYETSGNDANM
ncbi:hypothetical protein, partial [Intestinibacter sp.]|uniref:hypothetical protein n=1 Tax=Intestinibacter sp. TaxID=1965304 RepID=UPI002A751C52